MGCVGVCSLRWELEEERKAMGAANAGDFRRARALALARRLAVAHRCPGLA